MRSFGSGRDETVGRTREFTRKSNDNVSSPSFRKFCSRSRWRTLVSATLASLFEES